MRAAQIAGCGSALPQRVVSNDELSGLMDTNDEWIRSRTGIGARRWASGDETTSGLAAAAGAGALASAGIAPEAVDLVIVATVSGDRPLPATASYVSAALGIRGAAFDLAAGCAGFVSALAMAGAAVEAGRAETVLVAGAETLSRFVSLADRSTAVLFGDGAGAVVVTPGDGPGLIDSVLDGDPSHAELLRIPAGGSREPASAETVAADRHTIRMADGTEVFRRAVESMSEACLRVLDKAGFTPGDVSLFVPHQANARILRAVAHRLGLPPERVAVDVEHVGNTSAASVPIALDGAWRAGRIAPGDLVVTAAFGAGLAWGANLIRWTAAAPA
jgi:3-oxoacyl-[acyl-carrier-protein] synthase-3